MSLVKELVLFRRLPLGTRFSYQNSDDVWVVLERHGCGLIAKWEGVQLGFIGQTICLADETEELTRALLVNVVC